jgi:hypothetical protein
LAVPPLTDGDISAKLVVLAVKADRAPGRLSQLLGVVADARHW